MHDIWLREKVFPLICYFPSYLQLCLFLISDLLNINGLGVGTGLPFQQSDSDSRKNQGTSLNALGSDILDSNLHELRLEKSNILLLGPTGSGK